MTMEDELNHQDTPPRIECHLYEGTENKLSVKLMCITSILKTLTHHQAEVSLCYIFFSFQLSVSMGSLNKNKYLPRKAMVSNDKLSKDTFKKSKKLHRALFI